MAKSKKSLDTLNLEREQRFYESLYRISQGTTRKQAILQSGMDPRTFNKLLKERQDGATPLIMRTDSKGHYAIGQAYGSVSEWQVLDTFGNASREYFDHKYSQVLGRYWNAVENYLQYGNSSYLTGFKPQIVFSVDGKQFHLMLDKQRIKTWWDNLSEERQNAFNDDLYVKEASYAA